MSAKFFSERGENLKIQITTSSSRTDLFLAAHFGIWTSSTRSWPRCPQRWPIQISDTRIFLTCSELVCEICRSLWSQIISDLTGRGRFWNSFQTYLSKFVRLTIILLILYFFVPRVSCSTFDVSGLIEMPVRKCSSHLRYRALKYHRKRKMTHLHFSC